MKDGVSYLVAAYNAEGTLERSIASLQRQRYDDLQFVLIDDGSEDATASIIKRLAAQDRRITPIFLKKNVGLTKALNIGLEACEGEYVARHDADDISRLHRTRSQLSFAHRTGSRFTCARFLVHNRISPFYFSTRITKQSLRFGNFLCHGTFFIQRSLLGEIGGYNERWRYAQDFELVLRAIANGVSVRMNPECVYEFSRLSTSITFTKGTEQQNACRAALEFYFGNNGFSFPANRLASVLRAAESIFVRT